MYQQWKFYKKSWTKKSLTSLNFFKKLLVFLLYTHTLLFYLISIVKTYLLIFFTLIDITILFCFLDFSVEAIFNRIFLKKTFKYTFFKYYDYLNNIKKDLRKELIYFLEKCFGLKIKNSIIYYIDYFFENFIIIN